MPPESARSSKSGVKHIFWAVAAGVVLVVGIIVLLAATLGNLNSAKYAGELPDFWLSQLSGGNLAASNSAYAIVTNQVVPQLVDRMFHDIYDSDTRLWLVDLLNELPGVRIYYLQAEGRRAEAAAYLGQLGPAAAGAVPSLMQVVKGTDLHVRSIAISALGQIHAAPDTVIPFLTDCLTNEDLNDDAAEALGGYGSLAKGAVPKILPLLHSRDKDAVSAARGALKKIDPEAAHAAGIR
jgi:hypothetical protein